MISVVTDSTCDIPEELVEESHIQVIPALINIGQKTLRDGIDLTRETFYNLLPKLPQLPTTSAPSPAAFIEAYDRALTKSDHVISIHAASKLSGIYNAARLAAQEVAPDRIHVVDSGQVSMGLGWPVISAIEAIQQSVPLEGVLHSVRDTLSRLDVMALLSTVEYLSKGGRINLVQAGITNLLNIKPIIGLKEGVITSVARIRTWSRAVGTLTERVRSAAPIERLAVMHSNYLEGAQDVVERLKDVLPAGGKPLITNVTTVIGTHAGPSGVGVAAVVSKS